MDAALLTPSKYIKAIAFQGRDRTITITGVKLEELVREDNTKETKGLISVAETSKRWVLNVTNVKCLIAMFGRETDHWIGKRVVLYPAPNDMSESGFAIRVRGSPDLSADVTFTLKLARKKPRSVTLKATSKNGNGKPAPEPEPMNDEEPEQADDELGSNPDSDASYEALDGPKEQR
jgi:hypothetical protein